MNKELKNRVFDIPQEVLDKINHTIVGLNGKNVAGIQRAKTLLHDKRVKYGQLKRIIHDIQYLDKVKERLKYDLCGGQEMENWSKNFLKGERNIVSARKDSRKQADDITSMDGERRNSHLKRHTKKFSFTVPTNMVKSNSHKTSVSQLNVGKLFEEINKIKSLIKY